MLQFQYIRYIRDVILRFWLILSINRWHLDLVFRKFWSWFEKVVFITCSDSEVRRHSKTSFSLISPLNWHFKPWKLVFRKSWSLLKLFNMIRETPWKNNLFHNMLHIQHMTSFVYVIRLIFGSYLTWLLF